MTAVEPVHLRALNSVVRVEVKDEEIQAAVREAWDWLVVPPQEADITLPDPRDGDLSLPVALEQLTQRITVEAITARAGELLMLHACALADPASGRAVALVGPSGIGKTTLASALGRRWGYVTDETTAIDAAGGCRSYPKPLSVIREGHEAKVQVSPSQLGLLRSPELVQVAAYVLLDRSPEVRGLEVEEVRTVPALATLAEHTSYFAALPRPLQHLGALLTATGGLLRVRYAEAEDLDPLVAELVGGAR